MEIETLTRKWGNSIAVIIPSGIAEQEKLKENEKVIIRVERPKVKAGALFGKFPKWRLTTQEMKDEVRRGWLSASDREREEEWKKNERKK
ncbi:MAG: AbrB/MazE/SpoVT family DNA-binding domain-containing protein [Nanoarchaeota archaeon]